jgi:exopolysaccharide (amylovoran) exporter
MSIKKEALWVFSSTGISAVSQLLILALLAKSADASVLGELAIINVVLALAFLLQDMGLSSYFIHRQSLNKNEESTLFAINVCLGCAATLIVLLAAYPVGWFYESESITSGLILVAFNFILIGATSQYQAHYIKALKNDV